MLSYFHRHRRQRTAAAAALEAFDRMQFERNEEGSEEESEEETSPEQVGAVQQITTPAVIIQHEITPLASNSFQSFNGIFRNISGWFGTMQNTVNLIGCFVFGYFLYNFIVGDEEQIEAVIIRRGIFG